MVQNNAVQWIAWLFSRAPNSAPLMGWIVPGARLMVVTLPVIMAGLMLAEWRLVSLDSVDQGTPGGKLEVLLTGHVFTHGCEIRTARMNGQSFPVDREGNFEIRLKAPTKALTAFLEFTAPGCSGALKEVKVRPDIRRYSLAASIFPHFAQDTRKRNLREVQFRAQSGDRRMSRKMWAVADLIEQYAIQSGLSPALVYAVVHTESNFDAHARSPANAVGLMQLIPTEGALAAATYLDEPARNASAKSLRDPAINLRLGVGYLQLLTDRYFHNVRDDDARLGLVLAAYNWGPGNVQALLRQTGRTPGSLLEVKRLLARGAPAETRRYVQKVTERMAFYEQLV